MYAHAARLLATGRRRRSSSATPSRRCGRSRRTTPGRTAQLHAPRLLRARARRGLRPRPHPPPRAHPPGPEGGPPAAHARHAGEPLPHLLALRRPRRRRVGRAVPPHGERSRGARSTDEDGTQHRLWRVPEQDAAARGRRGAARHRAADRRRPPPLRDRARLRRRARRRGRPPLRADVPGRAPGPRPHRLPHPPAADAPRRRPARRPARGDQARLGDGRGRRRRAPARGGRATARSASATSTPTTSAR